MYIARQPILDRHRDVTGYEFLFRSRMGPITDDVWATSQVVASVFSDPQFSEALGTQRGFINVDSEFLLSDSVELLPPAHTVIELLEDTQFTPDVVARCRALKAMGYVLAIDDYRGDFASIAPVLDFIDIIKVDLPRVSDEDLAGIVDTFRGKTLVAEKVETEEEFKRCLDAGYTQFQGYFFARPTSVGDIKHDPNRWAAVSLLALVVQGAPISQLEAEFKRHGDLVVGLLRLVNSAASGLTRPLQSVHQALMALGNKQLQVWLKMLVYLGADRSDPIADPLLQMASVRAKLMELLAIRLGSTGQREFVTGLVSLFDVVLQTSRERICRRLGLSELMRDALMHYTGRLGALLAVVEAMERDESRIPGPAFDVVSGISDADLVMMSVQAQIWASSLGRAKN